MSKQKKLESLKNSLSLFKHRIEGKVRFEDIDLMQVVHNLKYMYWMETARVEFLQEFLFPEGNGRFYDVFPLLIVYNDVDYFGKAGFNEKYSVLTRVAELGKSSLKVENVVLNYKDEPIVRCITTFVHTDKNYSGSKVIPDEIREKLKKYM